MLIQVGRNFGVFLEPKQVLDRARFYLIFQNVRAVGWPIIVIMPLSNPLGRILENLSPTLSQRQTTKIQ